MRVLLIISGFWFTVPVFACSELVKDNVIKFNRLSVELDTLKKDAPDSPAIKEIERRLNDILKKMDSMNGTDCFYKLLNK